MSQQPSLSSSHAADKEVATAHDASSRGQQRGALPMEVSAELHDDGDDGVVMVEEDDHEDEDDSDDVVQGWSRGGTLPSTSVTADRNRPPLPATKLQYDTQDHTMASPVSPRVKRRVWVLPRALLPTESATHMPAVSGSAASATPSSVGGWHNTSEAVSSTRTSTQSAAAGASCGSGGGGVLSDSTHSISAESASTALVRRGSGCDGLAGAGEGGTSARHPLAARVVRIPHPRHGQPTLYLTQPCSSTAAASQASPSSPPSNEMLFEIQAQAPPSEFAQTWFVDDHVLPSHPHNGELLLVTPVDLTYFAMAELLGDAAVYARLAHSFMSPADLYRSGVGRAPAPSPAAPPPSTGESSPYVSVFGGIGGDDPDHDGSQSSSSSSPPFTLSFASAATRGAPARDPSSTHHAAAVVLPCASTQPQPALDVGAPQGWCGWAHAAAHHPVLFHACWVALQSDAVLRRLCEVRTMPHDGPDGRGMPDVFYRPSDAVTVAWLKRKVERLRTSAVLRQMLQLPDRSPAEVAAPAPLPSSPSALLDTTNSTAAAATAAKPETSAEVPMSIAFGLVVEYVPERLHGPLAVACGLPDPSAVPPASTASSSLASVDVAATAAGGKRGRAEEAMNFAASYVAKQTTPEASALAAAGPKSASVRRLEKAGRPKGTPTLFAMFAKQKKDDD